MMSDHTISSLYIALEDLYQRAIGCNASWDEPIAMHAVEQPHLVGSCILEHPANMQAVPFLSRPHDLDEGRWQRSVFQGKTFSEINQGAWKDRLYSAFLKKPVAQTADKTAFHYPMHSPLHEDDEHSPSCQDDREICASNDSCLLLRLLLHMESPGCNSYKRESASGNCSKLEDSASSQYETECCASNDPSLLLSCLLHEGCPRCNKFIKDDSASSQYAKEVFPSSNSLLLLSRLLHEESTTGCNSFMEDSASSQYAKEIFPISNDLSLLLSRLLHEESTPGCNNAKKDSSSGQYAKDICASNDPSLLISRLLREERTPGCNNSQKDSSSGQYSKDICASNDPSLLISRLLREERTPGCNSCKEYSALSQYAQDICANNDPSSLLSRLLHEESPGCNSLEQDSASSQNVKEICASNDPSLLLLRLLHEESPGCSSYEEEIKSELYSSRKSLSLNYSSRAQLGSSSTQVASSCCLCFDQYTVVDEQEKPNNNHVDGIAKTDYAFFISISACSFQRTDPIQNLTGMLDELQCELSVSEPWSEKFMKVFEESTSSNHMICSAAISSSVQSPEASGVEQRNVDDAPAYLLRPGEGEKLVIIEDFFVVDHQYSNSRERNLNNCYQRSENEVFESEVGNFEEITNREWSSDREVGFDLEEASDDESSDNRAVLKTKSAQLLDEWLIL